MEKDFIKAAKNGDTVKIAELLALRPDLVSATDADGSTALHCAAWKGHLAVVEVLLAAGSDVHAHNQNGHWGTTPLHAAAHANQGPIARILIEHGADVNAKDANSNTPLFHTTFHKATAAAKVLKERGAILYEASAH